MSTPDVSVIVISFNDAARLPRAIASIRRQTLRNLEIIVVDDASVDDTESVVFALAEQDPRIRYERLVENSGGCSAPRNRGIELARGEWVMFCDSDDEYERHACKNLLRAAERMNADVVCGVAERVDVASGRTRRWLPELHAVEFVADHLEQVPELLSDTISVNKIYRRSLLADNDITFPLGLLFEDQLFTLKALATARRVASIPQTVYYWYVDRLSDEPSITQRRAEAANVDSRIAINREIDQFLDVRGLPAVRSLKDFKFLKHDLYLYLSSILVVDDETARELMRRMRPYVDSVNLQPAWRLRPALRVAIYHLLVDDLEGIRSAMRFVRWSSVVDVPIIDVDGRQMWSCEHALDGGAVGGFEAARWLDVTDLHLLDVPFTQRRFLHRLDKLRISDGILTASGSTVDYDGSIAECDGVELRFALGSDSAAATVRGEWLDTSAGRRGWRATGPINGVLGRPLDPRDWGVLALAVRRGELVNATGVRSAVSAPELSLPFPSATAFDGPGLLAVSSGDNGAVEWHATPARAQKPRAATGWWARFERFWRNEVSVPMSGFAGSVLPARQLVVFDTSDARPTNADARVISDYLHEHHPEIAQAWVHRGRPTRVPEFAEAVERLSPRHHWLAARARWLVDDGTASLDVQTRKGGTVLFPMDGVPIHRLGLDDPTVRSNRPIAGEARRRGRRWSTVAVPSRYAAEIATSAWSVSGEVHPTGLARADRMLGILREGDDARARLRAALDLDLERPVVLYAPASRGRGRDPQPPLLDLEEWCAALGDRVYLLVRSHPAERLEISTRWRFGVRDVGEPSLIGDVLAASDLFVSDYSSLIGDAALARRPIMFFQPDRDDYVNRVHGLYVDLARVGPQARTTGELIAEVQAWLDDPAGWSLDHREMVRAFADDHCGPADGRSTERAVAALLGSALAPARGRDG